MHHLTRHLHRHHRSRSDRSSPSQNNAQNSYNPPSTSSPPSTPYIPLLPTYPPPFSDLPASQRHGLLLAIQDYQLTHALLLKYRQPDSIVPRVVPVGVSVFPTPFPRRLWEDVRRLQGPMGEVYLRAFEGVGEGGDREGGELGLGSFLQNDPFAKILWDIHLAVEKEGYAQDLSLGIFRSDYMVHLEDGDGNTRESEHQDPPKHGRAVNEYEDKESQIKRLQLKQIEMNTFSVAGICHATHVAEMHRHLAQTIHHIPSPKSSTSPNPPSLPPNPLLASLVSLLASVHALYTPTPSSSSSTSPSRNRNRTRRTAILIPTQPSNFNIADERPIEYRLWHHSPPIPTYRVVFPDEILNRCRLGPNRELLFRPPKINVDFQPSVNEDESDERDEELEISLIYYRAGYEPSEYEYEYAADPKSSKLFHSDFGSTPGIAARMMLALSRAIQTPDLRAHLATFKSIQRAVSTASAVTLSKLLLPGSGSDLELAGPRNADSPSLVVASGGGGLKKVDVGAELEAEIANNYTSRNRKAMVAKLRDTFLPFASPSSILSPSPSPDSAFPSVTTDLENYVLKPNLEGGSHAVFGANTDADIPAYLRQQLQLLHTTPSESDPDPASVLDDRFILQRLARTPPFAHNTLLLPSFPSSSKSPAAPKGIYTGPVVSEVGGVGGVLFRRKRKQKSHGKEGKDGGGTESLEVEILRSEFLGWTFKTKPAPAPAPQGGGRGGGRGAGTEMSVVKGYGGFDWPVLVGGDEDVESELDFEDDCAGEGGGRSGSGSGSD